MKRRFRLQTRVTLLIVVAVTPAWITAALFLWNWEVSLAARLSLLSLITIAAVAAAAAALRRIVRPLQSLANMLEGLREGDYSLRGRTIDPEDALGEVMIEVNTLSRTLHDQRLEALEAGVLLEKVIADVDIAVFAFDVHQRLRLVNRAGAALYGRQRGELRGSSAQELGLKPMLEGASGRIVTHAFPERAGRWETRRRYFREGGRPHDLLVITDVSRALREEERLTWQRLVRVIGHELNSSLTPIKSMAGTLRKLVARDPPPADWREDTKAGLSIIHDRAESLSRFMEAYSRLARLPPPSRRDEDFGALVRRAAAMYGEDVTIVPGPDVTVSVDGDQIEQVLINLIKNAVEANRISGAAAPETAAGGAGVRVCWRVLSDGLAVTVEDHGPGLARTENLWTPFFTTKQGGTGLGLVLSREIVENHGGTIGLENRPDTRGCIATVSLPDSRTSIVWGQ